MPLGNPDDGYLSAPFPWVSSSVYTTAPARHDFGRVTRWIAVRNFGPGELAIGFTRNGVQGANRFVLNAGQLFEAALSCKELHVVALSTTSSGSIFAGLGGTPARTMPLLTGSQWDGVG